MAPEQVRGAARADERADIYAVGAVAFRALSGRLPFEASTAHVLVALKLEREAPSLAEATGDQWPTGVERFLERALALKRELRFATAGEALAVWRSIQPSAVARRPPAVTMGAPAPKPAVTMGAPAPKPPAPSPPAVPPPRASSPSIPRPLSSQLGHDGGFRPQTPGTAPPPPRSVKTPSAIIPAPTKPVVTVYGSRPVTMAAPAPEPPAAPAPPPVRPPMESFEVVEDPPTEVDGPPTMTLDGYDPELHLEPHPEPLDHAKRRNAGRS